MDSIPAVQKHLYQSHEKVSDDLKGFIFKQLILDDQIRDATLPFPWTSRGIHTLKRNNWSVSLKWSIELEFAESLIVWHIATEICYQLNAAAMQFFEQKTREKQQILHMTEACKELLDQVKTKDNLTVPNGKRNKSKFLLYNGCLLTLKLHTIDNGKERWRVISAIWIEMLAYAASKCDTECHARQLRRGGELLTHVWFLMTHFGLTDYFKIKSVPATADMIVK